MKFRTLILTLIAASFIGTLFATDVTPTPPAKVQTSGGNHYGSVILESLQSSGLVKLNGTSVLNLLHVTGSLISNNAVIGSLEVTGEANLTGTTVQNGGSIIGSLQASRSLFQKNITILTQKAVFTNSQLEGITVRKDSAAKIKQVIELKQKSVVNGSIHFESGKGEVIVYPGSQVLGQVTGGKVIKKS